MSTTQAQTVEARIAVLYRELKVREAAAPNLRAGSIVARQNASAIAHLYDRLCALHIEQIEGVA